MDPETYREKYLQPLREVAAEATRKTPVEPPFLARGRYYSDHETSPYMYNFDMDKLTRDELLRVITEIGFAPPSEMRPGQLIGWHRDKDRSRDDMHALLVEHERLLAKQENELAGLRHATTYPSYRAYRALLWPPRMLLRLWRRQRPRA